MAKLGETKVIAGNLTTLPTYSQLVAQFGKQTADGVQSLLAGGTSPINIVELDAWTGMRHYEYDLPGDTDTWQPNRTVLASPSTRNEAPTVIGFAGPGPSPDTIVKNLGLNVKPTGVIAYGNVTAPVYNQVYQQATQQPQSQPTTYKTIAAPTSPSQVAVSPSQTIIDVPVEKTPGELTNIPTVNTGGYPGGGTQGAGASQPSAFSDVPQWFWIVLAVMGGMILLQGRRA